MSAFNDEDAQIEAVRQWWSRNWKGLTGGIVVGLAVVIGWQIWSHHESSHRLRASQLYQRFSRAISGSGNENVTALANRLKRIYDDTPYAAMAELKLAQVEVADGRFKNASSHLRWVAGHGEDAGIRAVAHLRLAAVLWQLNKPDQALSLLKGHPPQQFRGLYEMLRGDIFNSQHRDSRARQAYEQALLLLPQGSPESKVVREKLANIVQPDSSSHTDVLSSQKSSKPAGVQMDKGSKKP